MKEQPPYLSDAEADRVWRQSNDSLFGDTTPTNLELEQQIQYLQRTLDQRRQTTQPSPRNPDKEIATDTQDQQQPPKQSLESRVFRQGYRSPTADKNQKTSVNQSKSSNFKFFQKMDVTETGKDPSPKKNKSMDQSSSSNDPVDWSNYEIDP